jgi:hypothetical protein
VVEFEKDPCQGIAFRHGGKLGDSITGVARVFGALVECIDDRGRAAPSAPRTSCLAWEAGLEGPLFHGGMGSIKVFRHERFLSANRVLPHPLRRALTRVSFQTAPLHIYR